MNYQSLEANIVSRIQAYITGVDIMPLPEVDIDVLLPSVHGKITVAYKGSDYDPSDTYDAVAQPERISFELIVQSRKLRGTTGIYNLLSTIKSALLGWQTPVSEKIQFSKSTYVAHENGVWTYVLTLSTMALSIEEPQDESLVISRKLTAANESHETIVVESTVPVTP